MKRFFILLLAFTFLLSGCVEGIIPSESEKGIDLYGTYDQNDLLVEEIVEGHDGIDVKIPQLKGLKNTEIQQKINTDIYNRAMLLASKHPVINYANYYTYASFANVISISFNVGFDESPYTEFDYFNYNLVDGSPLKLEDLFMKDTDLLEIVRPAFYNSMAIYGNYDMETQLSSPDENKVYKTVKGYMESEDKRFAFSPSGIFLYAGNDMAEIKMLDYADSICIYSKFLTDESIFTGEYTGFKNIFTCANSQYDLFEVIEYGYAEKNLWTDLTVGTSYFSYDSPLEEVKKEKFDAFKAEMVEAARREIEQMRETARANPDKFYIILSKPDAYLYNHSRYNNGKWHYTYSNVASVNENTQIFEMPMDIYETVYRDKIIDTYRYEYFAMRGGAYLDTNEAEGATVTEKRSSRLYNFITGEELTRLEDIFYEDSDYMEVIKDKVVSSIMSQLDYSREEAEELFLEAEFFLEGISIDISLPSVNDRDFVRKISLSEFEQSMLKVFEEV